MHALDGPGGFAVSARLPGADLGTGTQAAAPERRQVRVNGAAAAALRGTTATSPAFRASPFFSPSPLALTRGLLPARLRWI